MVTVYYNIYIHVQVIHLYIFEFILHSKNMAEHLLYRCRRRRERAFLSRPVTVVVLSIFFCCFFLHPRLFLFFLLCCTVSLFIVALGVRKMDLLRCFAGVSKSLNPLFLFFLFCVKYFRLFVFQKPLLSLSANVCKC